MLKNLQGTRWLMAALLYGTGLRLMECLRLRVKDVDLGRGERVVREGKGMKDRVTLLPMKVRQPLTAHLTRPVRDAVLVTPSRRTSSRTATTSERSRSSSGTGTSAQR